MKQVVWQFFIGLVTVISLTFAGCGGGGDSGTSGGQPNASAAKKTCINNYYRKDDQSTGFSICVEGVDQDYCSAIAAEDDTWGVDAFMIEPSCIAAGFPQDSLDAIDGKDTYLMMEQYQDTGTVGSAEVAALFPNVDEDELLNKSGKDTIRTGSSDAVVIVKPLDANASILVSAADVIADHSDTGKVVLKSSMNGAPNLAKNSPLYVDNVFKGFVTSIKDTGSGLEIGLKSAENVDDVYSEFNVEMRNDSLLSAVQRAISQQKIHGTYDSENDHPLHFHVMKKPVTNARGLVEDEIVLRVDIPEGYHVPIEARGISCDFSDLECAFTVKGSAVDKLDLGKKYGENGLTFSTEGSYLEIGLGTYIRAHYDKNIFTASTYDFMIAQSGYFKSSMKVNITGELSSDWSTELKLVNDFDIEIVHPYSAIVKTSVAVAPVITFGVEGKLTGSVTASSYVERGGEVRMQYDSQTDIHRFGSNLKYTPKDMNKDAVDVAVKAEAHAYIFPNLLMIPNLKFLRINKPLTFVYARSGVKLDNAVEGKIEKGFVVENGTGQDVTASEASVTTTLYGLVQGRWMVRVGGIDFYHSASYKDIYKTGALEILQWKAQLLSPPKVVVHEKDGKKQVSFDSDDNDKIRGHLYFYYTVAPKNEAKYDIAVSGIENHRPVWRIGDKPITVDENSIVKVRSVLYNKDVSTSIWAWGTSVSEQTQREIVNMIAPQISPSSQSFEGSLTITLTQDQGYDIYYSINSGSSKKYSGPFNVDETATVTAYAKADINGKTVLSEEASASYTKCENDEILTGGECVSSSSSSSSSGSDGYYYLPSEYACEQGGGSYYHSFASGADVCMAYWDEAMNICQLPSKREWQEVIDQCNTDSEDTFYSDANNDYVRCLKSLGYDYEEGMSLSYWSSDTFQEDGDKFAYIMSTDLNYLVGGWIYHDSNSGSRNLVRCVSGGR